MTIVTFKNLQKMTGEYVENPSSVSTRSASFPSFTPATIAPIIKRINAIPDNRQYAVVAHIGHGKAIRPNASSCFGTRRPHILLHINASEEGDEMKAAEAWTNGLVSDLKATGEVMKPVYVSFMGEDEATHESFGENWHRLKLLKQRFDKENVFGTAQPKVPVV